jgi:hypothetical protein
MKKNKLNVAGRENATSLPDLKYDLRIPSAEALIGDSPTYLGI